MINYYYVCAKCNALACFDVVLSARRAGGKWAQHLGRGGKDQLLIDNELGEMRPSWENFCRTNSKEGRARTFFKTAKRQWGRRQCKQSKGHAVKNCVKVIKNGVKSKCKKFILVKGRRTRDGNAWMALWWLFCDIAE
jgi:hypothetical protein